MTLVAICIPHTGMFYATFVTKTLLPLTNSKAAFDKMLITERGHGVARQRNILVEQALDSGADYILFLDSDMTIPDPNAALQALVDLDSPIASGLARMKQSKGGEVFPYSVFTEQSGEYRAVATFQDSLIHVDAVGMFFTLIQKEVFEALEKPWFNDLTGIGEDLYFCKKARAAGYRILVDTNIRLGHVGIFELGTDLSVRAIN